MCIWKKEIYSFHIIKNINLFIIFQSNLSRSIKLSCFKKNLKFKPFKCLKCLFFGKSTLLILISLISFYFKSKLIDWVNIDYKRKIRVADLKKIFYDAKIWFMERQICTKIKIKYFYLCIIFYIHKRKLWRTRFLLHKKISSLTSWLISSKQKNKK